MTTHEERDLLLDLAYGELSERDARRVREHVAGCAECRAELEQLQGTRHLMSALPDLPAPERGERILLAAAREQAERTRPARWALPRWLVPAVALAATVTVVTVVSLRMGEEAVLPVSGVETKFAKAPPPAAAAAEAPAAGAVAPPSAPARDEAKREAGERYAQAPPPPVRAAPAPLRRDAPAGPPVTAQNRAATKDEADAASAYDWGEAEEAEGAAGGVAVARPAPAEAPVASAAPAPVPAKPSASGEARAAKSAGAPASSRAAEQAPSAREPVADAAGAAPLVRTFPGCPGELRREIAREAGGRVVRYAREGMAGGRRVRVELTFGPDGSVTSSSGRDAESGAPVPAGALPGLPRSAAQVDPDAPPRCGP